MNPSVAAKLPAAVDPFVPALQIDAHLMARLIKLLEQIEGELAARRIIAASLEEAPATLISASSRTRAERTVAPLKPRRAPWLITGGLVIAAAGALLYRFHDQFGRPPWTLPLSVQSSEPAVATDPVAVAPAATPDSVATAVQSGPASAFATQAEIPARADAQSAGFVVSKTAPGPPGSQAVSEAPAPEAEPPAATTAPEVSEPAQSMLASPGPASSGEETANAQPADASERFVAPVRGPPPAGANDCRDAALSAMGLCGVTR